jgi:hypothetical protein
MDYGVGSKLFFTTLLSNGRDKAVYKVKVCIRQWSFLTIQEHRIARRNKQALCAQLLTQVIGLPP